MSTLVFAVTSAHIVAVNVFAVGINCFTITVATVALIRLRPTHNYRSVSINYWEWRAFLRGTCNSENIIKIERKFQDHFSSSYWNNLSQNVVTAPTMNWFKVLTTDKAWNGDTDHLRMPKRRRSRLQYNSSTHEDRSTGISAIHD